MKFTLILVIIAAIGCKGVITQQPTKTERLNKTWREGYRHLKFNVLTDSSAFLEGEPVMITVNVTAEEDQTNDLGQGIYIVLQIRKDGNIWEYVPNFGCGTGMLSNPSWRNKTVRLNLNGKYHEKGARPTRPLMDFSPGLYTGYVDNGEKSSPFAFTVYPYPDSLQPAWGRYQYAARMQRGVSKFDSQQDLDSTRALSEYFLSMPPGYPFRVKGLFACVEAFSKLKDFSDDADLTQSENMIRALSVEDSASPMHILHAIFWTLLPAHDLNYSDLLHDDMENQVEVAARRIAPGRVSDKAAELVRLRVETGQRPMLDPNAE